MDRRMFAAKLARHVPLFCSNMTSVHHCCNVVLEIDFSVFDYIP